MKRRKAQPVSLEDLREHEFSLYEPVQDFSDLHAEQELDFNAEQSREYEPEVWEVENESDDEEPSK